MPRLATTGQVTIVPPAGDPPYVSVNSVHIDSFRNVDAFPFPNFSFDGLSLGELADASVVSGGTMTATRVTAGRTVAVTIR